MPDRAMTNVSLPLSYSDVLRLFSNRADNDHMSHLFNPQNHVLSTSTSTFLINSALTFGDLPGMNTGKLHCI